MKTLLNRLIILTLLISGVSSCIAKKTEAEIKGEKRNAEAKEFLDNWEPYIPEMAKGKVDSVFVSA